MPEKYLFPQTGRSPTIQWLVTVQSPGSVPSLASSFIGSCKLQASKDQICTMAHVQLHIYGKRARSHDLVLPTDMVASSHIECSSTRKDFYIEVDPCVIKF